MPRRPRIDLAGYHHVMNRGVNRSTVFVDDDDYEVFLKIVCKACNDYQVVNKGSGDNDNYILHPFNHTSKTTIPKYRFQVNVIA